MMYCHWLRHRTKRGYRLPTEAEWEFACRAGQTGPFGFDEKAEKLGDHAWFIGNSATNEHTDANSKRGEAKEPTTHKVGVKKPNKYGLHDMHGNVWEWCLDHYDAKFYERFPADKLTLNPVNMPTAAKWSHTVRGGSWADKPEQLRSAARRSSDKSWMKHDPQFPRSIWWLTKLDVIGFRVALPVEEYPELAGLKPMVIKKGQ
jgi:formylglycine-generating enzyme required for sulfatase activity